MSKTRPLSWAMSYVGEVKDSEVPVCFNPRGKGTLTGDQLRVVVESAQKLSPDNVRVYVENNDECYLHLKSSPPEDESIVKNDLYLYVENNDEIWYATKTTEGIIRAQIKKEEYPKYFDHLLATLKEQAPEEEKLKKLDRMAKAVLLDITLEREHTHAYYRKWLKDNETLLASVGGVIDLNKLKIKDPLWQLIFKRYMEERQTKPNLVQMMKQDMENVLTTHPEWKDSVEEHIIDTAIHVAWIMVQKAKRNADVTFMWYQHELSQTIIHIMQFMRDNAALIKNDNNQVVGLKPANLKHFPFKLQNLFEEQKKTPPQKAVVEVAPVPVSPREDIGDDARDVVERSMRSYVFEVHRQEGKQGVAQFYGLLIAAIKKVQPTQERDSPVEEMKTKDSPSSSPRLQAANQRVPIEEMKTRDSSNSKASNNVSYASSSTLSPLRANSAIGKAASSTKTAAFGRTPLSSGKTTLPTCKAEEGGAPGLSTPAWRANTTGSKRR